MAAMAAMIKTCVAALLAVALSVGSAAAASFSMKRGINLDIWETWPGEDRWSEAEVILPFPEWRKRLTEADLKALAADGFDFVRIPVDPSVFLSGKTEALRKQLFASVLEAARAVNAAGLKVVVDLHLIQSGGNGQIGMTEVMADPEQFDRYVEIVRQMAQTLSRQDPQRVALELMNEPVVDCEPGEVKVWPERLQRLYAAARASATRLTLVLSGGCWASAEGLAAIDPKAIPDDNVIWTFHSYAPFLLTHQGATWAGDFIPYVTGLPYPPYDVPRAELDTALDKIRKKIRAEAPMLRRSGLLSYLDEQVATVDSKEKLAAELDAPFALVAAWAAKNGVASDDIYLGEFGMIRQEYGNPNVMPGRWRAAYVKDMIARAETHGYAWSVWGYGGAFGIVDEFEGRKADPDVLEVVRGLK
ncbi:glycoside hydrolase family 5 protein [Aminobacter sp. HY435]|uniref:glycoside hydrolase family 5 protein n=1 Tax=Aminobacter sp. HY435 TaxID=2970917 RepID=UPI0022B99F12|nr:cellulase family glycosylhydrolase [Aminobacter sp. HY435]